MANPKIKFKRSSVLNKRPDIDSLELGELAINTYDGRLFVKRDTSGAAGIDTGNKLVNPWIENNSNTGVACTHDIQVSGISTFNDHVVINDINNLGTEHNFKVQSSGNTKFSVLGNGAVLLGASAAEPFIATQDHHSTSKKYVDTAVAVPQAGVDNIVNSITNGFVVSGIVTAVTINCTDLVTTSDVSIGGTTDVTGNVSIGGSLGVGSTAYFNGNIDIPDDGVINIGSSDDLKIYHDGDHSYIDETGQGNLKVRTNTFRVSNPDESKVSVLAQPGSDVELYYDNTERLRTTDGGVIVTGVTTSTSFVGDVTGDLTGDVTGSVSGTSGGLSGSPSITVTNLIATGDVSIAGTITYEDVTSVDSVGVITARSGMDLSGHANIQGTLNVSGISTFTTVKASTLNLSSIPTYANDSDAGAGGLVSGDVYKTSEGSLRIKT